MKSILLVFIVLVAKCICEENRLNFTLNSLSAAPKNLNLTEPKMISSTDQQINNIKNNNPPKNELIIEENSKDLIPSSSTRKSNFNSILHTSGTRLLPLYKRYIEESAKEVPIAQNILAYQNALIARENAIYERRRAEILLNQLKHLKPYIGFNLEKLNDDYYNIEEEIDDDDDDEETPQNEENNAEYEDVEEKNALQEKNEPEQDEECIEAKKEDDKKKPDPFYEVIYYTDIEFDHNLSKGTKKKPEEPEAVPPQFQQPEAEEEEEEEESEDEAEREPEEEEEEEKNEEKPEKEVPQIKEPFKIEYSNDGDFEEEFQKQKEQYDQNNNNNNKERQGIISPNKEKVYLSDVQYEKNTVYEAGEPKEKISYIIQPRINSHLVDFPPSQLNLEEDDEPEEEFSKNNNNNEFEFTDNDENSLERNPIEENIKKYRDNIVKYHSTNNKR